MTRQSGGRSNRATGRTPTMADVARLAGVSMTTVSFVLNGRTETGLREDTQQRVRDAILELGYRPNRHAQALVRRSSQTIGFIGESLGTPFGGRIISGAHDHLRGKDSVLLILDAEQPDEVAECVEELLSHSVDGIVIGAEGTRNVKLPGSALRVPTMLVNCMIAEGMPVPSVLPDEEAGGRAAARMLLDAGHTEVACIAGDAKSWATKRRVKGFRAELGGAGIPLRSMPVSFGNYRTDSGYSLTMEAMRRRSRPTGIFYGNDRMALGAYFALAELGLSIPDDVSVVGYDDQEHLADSVYPPLSTVRLPFYAMGGIAAEALAENRHAAMPRRTLVDCVAVPRASIARPRTHLHPAVIRPVTAPLRTSAQASGR